MVGYDFAMRLNGVREAIDNNAIVELRFGQLVVVELVVHYEIERSAEVWNIALKVFVRIDGHSQTLQVQSIVGCEQLWNIGIFVAFHLFRREALCLEILESLIAHLVQDVAGMLLYHSLRLVI